MIDKIRNQLNTYLGRLRNIRIPYSGIFTYALIIYSLHLYESREYIKEYSKLERIACKNNEREALFEANRTMRDIDDHWRFKIVWWLESGRYFAASNYTEEHEPKPIDSMKRLQK